LLPHLRVSQGQLAMGAVALVVGFLALYPLAMLLFGSVWSSRPGLPGTLTLDNYVRAYTDPRTYELLVTTLLIMGLKTAIATALAVTFAWIVCRTDTPFRGLLTALFIAPFLVPGILDALAWVLLLSPKAGTINVFLRNMFGIETAFSIYSLGGMVWVMTHSSVSFIFLLVLSAMRNMDVSLEEAASIAGARPFGVATHVTLPLLAPAILSAAILSFIRALEAFEVPVLIGIPARIYVFTSRIYAAVQYDFPVNYGLATSLGVTFIAVTFGLVMLRNRYLGAKRFQTISGKGYRPRIVHLGPFRYVTLAFCLLYVALSTVLPLTQLLLVSLMRNAGVWAPESLSLGNYEHVVTDPQLVNGLVNTVVLGLVTAVIAMVLCSLIAYIVTRTRWAGRRFLEFVAWLPWTIPGIVVGLGILWAYTRFPVPVYGTVFILGIAFLTSAIPLGVQLMSGVMVQVGTDLEECARVHGATWWQVYRRVMVPLIRPALLAGVLILFVTFARAISSVVLLASPGTDLLAILLFKYFSGGQLELVSALAMVMLTLNMGCLLIARRLGFFADR
jgi:iron(III) transport system permease protein